jgi:hypothetical protein
MQKSIENETQMRVWLQEVTLLSDMKAEWNRGITQGAYLYCMSPHIKRVSGTLFLRRRLGVQASQGPGRPGRLANPHLIRFFFYFSYFLSFFTDMVSHCLALYSTRRHLSVSKGADRLTSPCRLKNIDLEWGICAAEHSLVEAEWDICAAELRLGHGTSRGG